MIETLIADCPLFAIPALIGTTLFALQMLFLLLGSDWEGDGILSFKWLSKQALTGFLMMFGWTGLACLFEAHFPLTGSILCAFGAGLATLLLASFLFRGAAKLKSSGSLFKIEDLEGKEAIVYQSIIPGSTGKITVSLNQLTYEIDARADTDLLIDSFSRVMIVRAIDERTVLVSNISQQKDSHVP